MTTGWLAWALILAAGLAPFSGRAAVQLGSEVLAARGFQELRGKRVGLITNPSGLNRQGQATVDLLRRAKEVKLVALFGAEHGLFGKAAAGEEVKDQVDQRTGLPIYSLYGPGPTRKPTPAMLKGLDVLAYDIQDTGCRSYTFISTLGLAMEACAEAGIEFVVLDRPNPLGGLRIEGPMLDPRHRSFVGQWEIPYVYGMTCGELARMINGERWISKPCRLRVIAMKGWSRKMVWSDTGLRWIPPSPNIPRGESPLYYASTGLLGSIGGVNIGFNLKRPFECVTAPWLDAHAFSDRLNQYSLPGVRFRPLVAAGEPFTQRGVRLEFTDPARAPLVAVNFYLLEAIRRLTGRDLFAEAVKAGKNFDLFDKLSGGHATRQNLAAGVSAGKLAATWKTGEDGFRQRRSKYLLYN